MRPYQKILAAVETTKEGFEILKRASQFAEAFGTELTVLSVVEFYAVTGELIEPTELSEERAKRTRGLLGEWCQQLGIAPRTEVIVGEPKLEVPKLAEALSADLLIIGHHPHRGLSAWISHTDQSVLGRATCDVLAISNKPH